MSFSEGDLFLPKKVIVSKKYRISVEVCDVSQYEVAKRKAKMIKLYEKHKSHSVVAQIMGYKDARTIRRSLKSVGYPITDNRMIVHVADEVLDEVIERMGTGDKLAAIARELNINLSTLKFKTKQRKEKLLEGQISKEDRNEIAKQKLICQCSLGSSAINY